MFNKNLKVGFIGAGFMGYGMAKNLIKNFHAHLIKLCPGHLIYQYQDLLVQIVVLSY